MPLPALLQAPVYDAIHRLSALTNLTTTHRKAVQDIAVTCFQSTSALCAVQQVSPMQLAVLTTLARASLYAGALAPRSNHDSITPPKGINKKDIK
jgi:hypothetical protein